MKGTVAADESAMKRTSGLTPHLRRVRNAPELDHGVEPRVEDPVAAEPEVDRAAAVRARIDAAGGDFAEALEEACVAAAEAAHAPHAAIRLVEGFRLRSWAQIGADQPLVEDVPIAGSVEGRAVSERQLILGNDASGLEPRSWLVLPLIHGDDVVGTLSVSAPQQDAFSTPPERARAAAQSLRDVAAALGPHLQTAAWLLERDRALDVMQGQINETEITAEMMSEGVIVFDGEGRYRRANNAAARLLGVGLEKIAGRHVRDALRTLVHEDGSEWPGEEQPPAQTLATGASFRDVIMGVHRPQGVPRWVSVSSRVLPDANGNPDGVVVVVSDCTERRGLREQLAHATLHDEATGLPNRSLLHLELDDAIDRSRRQGLGAALVQVALDDFDGMRARLGAHGADEVLHALGERLVQTARDGEMVARNGDDEFATVLAMLGDSERAVHAFVERVRGRLAEPVEVGRSSIEIHARLVVSVFPRDGRTADALLRHGALERLNGRALTP